MLAFRMFFINLYLNFWHLFNSLKADYLISITLSMVIRYIPFRNVTEQTYMNNSLMD